MTNELVDDDKSSEEIDDDEDEAGESSERLILATMGSTCANWEGR